MRKRPSGKGPTWQCKRHRDMGSILDIRDVGLILGSGRSPGGGHGNPLQYSCLQNPMDRGTWQATFHSVTKSRTWLKQFSMDTHNRWEANGLRRLNDTHAYCLSFDPPRSRPCNKSSSANSFLRDTRKNRGGRKWAKKEKSPVKDVLSAQLPLWATESGFQEKILEME